MSMEEWIYCRREKKQVDTAEYECCQGNSEKYLLGILEQIISWNLHLDFGLFKFEYPTADAGGPAVTSRWVATIKCNYVCSEYYPELLLCNRVMNRFSIPYHNSNLAWNCISHRTSVSECFKIFAMITSLLNFYLILVLWFGRTISDWGFQKTINKVKISKIVGRGDNKTYGVVSYKI